ncbi:hypothetical protein QBC38DRAFT_217290 [Podospora fimiseda]|uniref:Tafazzin n=1 Tax=Podospora fimiseda TaxID=252190 RepID=A0AAN7BNT0_9PEZI|nr:hypothetical protein QBC38DRAFT_217290 [Podospora fimiseda]
MPKKRHQTQYSKPPSTAPAALLGSSSRQHSSSGDTENKPRSVNELLANLRLSQGGTPTSSTVATAVVRRAAVALNRAAGRRLPAGPLPPVSWLYQQAQSSSSSTSSLNKPTSRTAIEYGGAKHFQQRPLPGGSRMPVKGSLMDLTLKAFAKSWDWQKEYCQYVLYQLPSHLRSALVSYLTRERQGVTISDLRLILLASESDDDDNDEETVVPVDNLDFNRLELTNSPGQTLKLRDLSKFLFPPNNEPSESSLPDSWDTPSEPFIPRSLLPNLTHLSLAINPLSSTIVAWPHLLSLARHLPPTLTHLSLAFWPEPSFSTSPLVSIPTTDHNSNGDASWSEPLMVLSRLSKLLYGLEYLDLTGCGSWVSCLWSTVGEDYVDWVDAWGQVERIVLYPGYELREDADVTDVARYLEVVENAGRVERWIRGMRRGERGKGRVARGIWVESSERRERIR